MKKEEIFEMTKHLDEKYILEAAAEPKKNIKLKKRIISFAVAAALTASLSVGAFAAYKALNRESVSTYYDSSAIDKLERSGYVSGQTTENEHFRFTLETAVKDNYNLLAVVSVEPLDSYAEQYIKKDYAAIFTNATYADTGDEVDGFASMAGMKGYEKGKAYSMRLEVPVNTVNGTADLSRPINLKFVRDQSNEAASDVDLFKGLSLDLKDIKQSKNAVFYSPAGEKLDVSEFSIAVDSPQFSVKDVESSDPAPGKEYKFKFDPEGVKMHYKDGTIGELREKLNAIYMYLTKEEKTVTILDLNTLIDPEQIDYIEYLGTTFKRK